MGRDVDAIAHRITQITDKHPERPRIAFDADGKMIDWQDAGADGWANGSHDAERVYEIAGGASVESVEESIRRADD